MGRGEPLPLLLFPLDPQEVIETVLESSVSAEVKQAVGRAESRQQALALLFMSAEFQRR